MAVAGVVLMRRPPPRRGQRDPAVAAVYFVYNAGYWLPFGGGTPGPRFLIPALPVPRARPRRPPTAACPPSRSGWRSPRRSSCWPARITFPLIGEQGTGDWADFVEDGRLEHTVLTALRSDQRLARDSLRVLAAIAVAVVARRPGDPADPVQDYRLAVPRRGGLGLRLRARRPQSPDEISPLNRRQHVRALADRRRARCCRSLTLTLLRVREGRTQPKSQGRLRPRARPRPGLAFDEPHLVDDQSGQLAGGERQALDRPPRRACLRRPLGQPEVEDHRPHAVVAAAARTVAASGKVSMSLDQIQIQAGLVLARPLTMSGKPSVDQSR